MAYLRHGSRVPLLQLWFHLTYRGLLQNASVVFCEITATQHNLTLSTCLTVSVILHLWQIIFRLETDTRDLPAGIHRIG